MEKIKNNKYTNYFKDHYRYLLSEKDIRRYLQWFAPFWKIISIYFKINSSTRIMEIGSGIGGFYAQIESKLQEKQYTGLELDKNASNFSNKYFHTDIFKNISLEDYKTNQKFDYIFAFEVLEHLHNPEAVIQKIYTLLKPGGLFIGTSPYPYSKNIFADETHLYVLHPENWKRLFLYNKFSSATLYPMSFLPFIWKISKWFHIRIPFFINIPFAISTTLIIAKKK